MDPIILDNREENNILKFTINNINVSYANAIRRTILSNIPTIVFRTFPYEKNNALFEINTSRLNNEILKQRLSCIPIHISDLEMPLEDYILEVNVKNNSDTILYVTTADFKIKNLTTNKYLNDSLKNDIFPPNNITHQYIDFCRLRSKLSDTIPGEHLKLSCKFSIATAKENGAFNVVSTCSYRNTPDNTKIEEKMSIKEEELRLKYTESSDIKHHLEDWRNLDAKRIYINNSFDFKIETIGIYTNIDIVTTAINIIIDKLNTIKDIYSKQNNLINDSEATIPNSYDIILEEEDYTIGKILEYTLYDLYYLENKSLTFCGFRKPHPHINISIIRIAFKEPTEKDKVVEYINNSADISIKFYQKLLELLKE